MSGLDGSDTSKKCMHFITKQIIIVILFKGYITILLLAFYQLLELRMCLTLKMEPYIHSSSVSTIDNYNHNPMVQICAIQEMNTFHNNMHQHVKVQTYKERRALLLFNTFTTSQIKINELILVRVHELNIC